MKNCLGLILLMTALGSSPAGQQGVTPPPPVPQSTPPQKIDDTDVVKITTNLVQVDALADRKYRTVTQMDGF